MLLLMAHRSITGKALFIPNFHNGIASRACYMILLKAHYKKVLKALYGILPKAHYRIAQRIQKYRVAPTTHYRKAG